MPSLINDYFIETIKPRTGRVIYPYCHTGIHEFYCRFICYALNEANRKTLFIEWLRAYPPMNAITIEIYTNDNNDQDNNEYHLHYYYH